MTKSEQFLMEAFAGESQANRKYLAFAKQAEKEGYPQVAKLFRAAAEAETVHAHAHLRTVSGIKSTAENLKAAIAGETHEFEHMYPEMITAAQAEGNKAAERSFTYANEVEKIHGNLYQEAIKMMESGGVLPEKDYYVCEKCGYTIADAAPDKCPVCGAKKNEFFKVD